MDLDLLVLKIYRSWLKIRKGSVISHWLLGILFSVLAVLWFPSAIIMLLLFALLEWWNDKEQIARNPNYLPEGCTDWWDSFVVFCVGLSIDVILNLAKVISIRWY